MEFTFDLSQTPVIGRKFVDFPITIEPEASEKDQSEPNSEHGEDGTAVPPGAHITENVVCGWKKPQLSQVRHICYTYYLVTGKAHILYILPLW